MAILHWDWAGEQRFAKNSAKQVTVGQNSDGHLEILYVGTNNDLFHNWQKKPNISDGANWAGEQRSAHNGANYSANQVAVAQNKDRHLEIFYVGTNNDLYHNWQKVPNISDNTNWMGQQRSAHNGANYSAKQVTVAPNQDGHLEIFYVGTNNDLYHNWQMQPNISDNLNWAGQQRLAHNGVNYSAKQVAAALNSDGRLEIFYVGTNNDLFHNWQIERNISDVTNWAGEERFAMDSAKQVAVAQNSDGRLEIFYVGTDNRLFHNWQIKPGVSDPANWFGETRFPGDSADQVAVARNADGRLEIFYVGTNNDIYHNWQMKPGISDNANWAGETVFPGDSAQQIAVGQNKDGHLEIFYVGTNNDLYHNWQVDPNSKWIDLNGVGGAVATPAPLGSNTNFVLGSNCNPMADVAVTVEVTQDIVYTGHGKPMKGSDSVSGFSFQLNCFSPAQFKDVAQQYVIGYDGSSLYWQVNNWKLDPKNPKQFDVLILEGGDLTGVGGHKLPAGWQLLISLDNDGNGNITGATFSVVDPKGNNPGKHSTSIGKSKQAPIMGFEMVLVGPGNSESVTFSSGAGIFQYLASSLLNVSVDLPVCAEPSMTQETANTLYGPMSADASNVLTQSFSLAAPELVMMHRVGPMRPPLVRHARR
jgi:hypothetical protein